MQARIIDDITEIYCQTCEIWYEAGDLIWIDGGYLCAFCYEEMKEG